MLSLGTTPSPASAGVDKTAANREFRFSVERTGIEPVTSGLQTQPDARHLSLLNADRLNRAARVLSASYAFAPCRRRDRPAEVVRAC